MVSKRLVTRILISCGILVLLVVCLAAGFFAGRVSTGIPLTISFGTTRLFKPFWEAWNIVHAEYLIQPIDDEKMMQGAIRGMLDSLGDPQTGYMSPTEYSDASAPIEGYSGIGAWVNTEGEFLTITEPMKGSPAEVAGLKAGDQILAIDGKDMKGVLPELARQKVLGPAGSKVVLTIKRASVDQSFDVTVTRAQITIPSTEYRMLNDSIAYIRLSAFSDTSSSELHSALQVLMDKNPKGLILDLRYNSGGLLTTAIDVGSEFLADGVVAYEEYGDRTRNTFNATGEGIATQVPMVVLVNEWSASASELVAGALQDRGRAQLVGVTTYGKGSVQNWIALTGDEGAIRVTIARWLTPNLRNVTGTGLKPDVDVIISDADVQAGIDTQLNKALEILSQP